MTVRDMEVFVSVAETGHIGAAAKKLYLSQPTVSHVILQIEKEYHVRLFERLSRKLHITETGQELLQYARHILANYKEMERYLYHAAEQLKLKIGASLTVGSVFLAGMVSQYEVENPNVRIRVVVENSKDIIRKIIEGSLDMAVIEGMAYSDEMVSKEIYEDEMVLICGKRHPFASWKSVCLSDLQNMDCVLREEGSGTRAFLINLVESHGIHIVEKWVCHSSDSIINIVAAGQGISVLSKSLLLHTDDVVQLPIRDLALTRSFRIIYHRDKYISSALKNLMNEIECFFANKEDKIVQETPKL
ncbi:MAG: LysR family transcriptional regulator [Ethanoligenens sp.]